MATAVLPALPDAPYDRPAGAARDDRIAVAMHDLGKCYRIFDRPRDRIKQLLFGRRRRCYREFWALRGVSLDVRRGETVGVMGRNGSGKSTLLQLICKTVRPTVGRVETVGRVAALLELGAGFNPEFSGRDNVCVNAAILGLAPNEIKDRFDEIVAFAELAPFIDQPVKTYSSGMYVRLAFAVAVSVDPDILVVDEALAVGDEAFQRKCFARIEAFQRQGGTILFVSHSPSTILELCSRAVLLDQGEHLLTGSPNEVVAWYQKLLYAPPETAASIRREIQGLGGERDSIVPRAPAVAPRPAAEAVTAHFDPELKATSTVVYPSAGAEIRDPRITTLDGRPVNVLVPNEEYVIRYRVRFAQAASQVRCAALIKGLRGVELSGLLAPRPSAPAIERVPAGAEVEPAFRFRCQLMPGVYAANAGVRGETAGQEGFLHRVVDALLFRVLPGDTRATAGMVDLFTDASVTVDERAMEQAA